MMNYFREFMNWMVDIYDYGMGWNSNYFSQVYKMVFWYLFWFFDFIGN